MVASTPLISLLDEHSREQGAENAADAVHAERIQGIVVAERVLERGGREVAHDARRQRR